MNVKKHLRSRQVGLVMTGLLGAMLFAATALFLLFLPQPLFEALVLRSGLPALAPMAAPPLGETARMLAACGLGAGVGSTGAALFFMLDRKFPARAPVRVESFHPETVDEAGPPRDAVAEDYGLLLERNLKPRFTLRVDDGGLLEEAHRLAGGASEPDAEATLGEAGVTRMPGFRRRADDSPRDPRDEAGAAVARAGPDEAPMIVDVAMLHPSAAAMDDGAGKTGTLDLGNWPDPDAVVDAEIEFTDFIEFEVVSPEYPTVEEAGTDAVADARPALEESPDPLAPAVRQAGRDPAALATEAPADRPDTGDEGSIAMLLQRLEAGLARQGERHASSGAPRDTARARAALDELRRMVQAR